MSFKGRSGTDNRTDFTHSICLYRERMESADSITSITKSIHVALYFACCKEDDYCVPEFFYNHRSLLKISIPHSKKEDFLRKLSD